MNLNYVAETKLPLPTSLSVEIVCRALLLLTSGFSKQNWIWLMVSHAKNGLKVSEVISQWSSSEVIWLLNCSMPLVRLCHAAVEEIGRLVRCSALDGKDLGYPELITFALSIRIPSIKFPWKLRMSLALHEPLLTRSVLCGSNSHQSLLCPNVTSFVSFDCWLLGTEGSANSIEGGWIYLESPVTSPTVKNQNTNSAHDLDTP